MSLKKIVFSAVLAVSAVSLTANDSFAFFGRHGGGGGSWGGSWGGGSWGGSWGSRGGWGSSGSWGGFSGCGSWGGGSGGSWGGGGSCGSWGGGYASSYGYSDGGYVTVRRPATTVAATSAPAVKTRLTLHVPADAKVTLAGVETKQSGEVRQFATSKLAAGQNWSDYKVVVEVTREGKTQREERTLNLTGGQDQELAVNFQNDSTQQVAQR